MILINGISGLSFSSLSYPPDLKTKKKKPHELLEKVKKDRTVSTSVTTVGNLVNLIEHNDLINVDATAGTFTFKNNKGNVLILTKKTYAKHNFFDR